MNTTIVISLYNPRPTVNNLINSIESYTPDDVRVVIVDNESDSVESLKLIRDIQRSHNIPAIRNDNTREIGALLKVYEHPGYSDTDVFVILHDNCIAKPGWYNIMTKDISPTTYRPWITFSPPFLGCSGDMSNRLRDTGKLYPIIGFGVVGLIMAIHRDSVTKAYDYLKTIVPYDRPSSELTERTVPMILNHIGVDANPVYPNGYHTYLDRRTDIYDTPILTKMRYRR